MKMHPYQALMFLLCSKVNTVLAVPIANIDCGDVCSSTSGSAYTMSCTWSGALTAGITWRLKGINVVVCNTGVCLPSTPGYASGNYPNSTTATLTITSYNATTDAGNWECQDGSDPLKSCTLPSVASGSLEGKCTSTGSEYSISCYGITDHGNPSARIDLTEGNTTLASTTSGGSVSSIQTDTAGKTYSCSVTGASTECLTPKSVDITCPATTESMTTSETTASVESSTSTSAPNTTDQDGNCTSGTVFSCPGHRIELTVFLSVGIPVVIELVIILIVCIKFQ